MLLASQTQKRASFMLNWVAREGRSRSWLKCHLLLLSCSVMSDCNPMDCSTPGFHVLHNLPEFTQINVYWVGDAIQPSYPLSSPHALNLSQHQNLFQWVGFSHQLAKVLELQFQLSSLPMNIQGWFPLELTGLILLKIDGHPDSSASYNFGTVLQELDQLFTLLKSTVSSQ